MLAIFLVTTTFYVLLSIYSGVGGCLCLISSRAWRAGMAYLQFMNSAPSSASAADEMAVLIILATVNTDPLLGGNSVLLDIKKCLPDMILDLVL